MKPQYVCECGGEEFAVYEADGKLELECARCNKIMTVEIEVSIHFAAEMVK